MIIIPMAGESRRFQEAGYLLPKYMLELHGRALFDWSLLSFQRYFDSETFIFIVRGGPDALNFVNVRASALGILDYQVVHLEHTTRGQAETVDLGLTKANVAGDMPIAIFNIDTIRPGLQLYWEKSLAGYLEVFRTTGDNWSFIEVDPQDPARVTRCVEKKRISELCCTGLYVFQRADSFRQAYRAELKNRSSHELFVAPMYNHLIDAGLRVSWTEVPKEQVILSGVPIEMEAVDATHLLGSFKNLPKR